MKLINKNFSESKKSGRWNQLELERIKNKASSQFTVLLIFQKESLIRRNLRKKTYGLTSSARNKETKKHQFCFSLSSKQTQKQQQQINKFKMFNESEKKSETLVFFFLSIF